MASIGTQQLLHTERTRYNPLIDAKTDRTARAKLNEKVRKNRTYTLSR